MKRILFFLFAGCVLFLDAASAAVISRDWQIPGDGLLTYDDTNRREWLDLTETQLFKFPRTTLEEQYQAVLAETIPGGLFAGFIQATRDDVFALAESAGIVTTTIHFETNQAASNSLIQLLGAPIPGAAPPNKWAGGFLDDSVLSISLAIAFVPAGRDDPAAGIGFTNFLGAGNGVWLYRVVPEPSTYVLIGITLGVLVLLRCQARFAIV